MGCACIIPDKSIKSKDMDLINNILDFQNYEKSKNAKNLDATKISYNLSNIKNTAICKNSDINNNTIIKSTNLKSTNIKSTNIKSSIIKSSFIKSSLINNSIINTSNLNNSIINQKENIEKPKNDEKEYILSGPIINYLKRTVKNHNSNKFKKEYNSKNVN